MSVCLFQLIGDSSIAVRSKALRCLSAVIEDDPGLLNLALRRSTAQGCGTQLTTPQLAALMDLPRLVHSRMLDQAIAAREAAVDLVSRFLLVRPAVLPHYYPMLLKRILDTGISVRKRAIRCFCDLLLMDWEGGAAATAVSATRKQSETGRRGKKALVPPQIRLEVCVKLIGRLRDEDTIQVGMVALDLIRSHACIMLKCCIRYEISNCGATIFYLVTLSRSVGMCRDFRRHQHRD